MTRIIDVKKIIPQLNSETYSTIFDITIDNTPVLTTTDFMHELEYMYYDMSYISHQSADKDLIAFIMLWDIYKKRHFDEWTKIFESVALTEAENYNPLNTYSETKITTPDLTVTSETTYGREVTDVVDSTDTLTHGKVTTDQTNTYDGTLRDSDKSTNSGSDTRSIDNTTTSTNSGSDSNTTTTTGTNTETKTGYNTNPVDSLQRFIDFSFKNNLRDLIINNFVREFLFYNNDNGEGGINGFFY